MRRLAAFTMAAALLSFPFAGVAMAQDFDAQRDAQRDYGTQRDRGWGHDGDRFQRVDLEGTWVAEGRDANFRGDRGDRGGRGMGGLMLPGLIRIDQRPRMVQIQDARHRTLSRIFIDRRFDPRDNGRSDLGNLTGRFQGNTLVAETTGPRGTTITQTFSLENRGRTLVVRTKREGWSSGRTMELTTIYHRA